MGKPRQKKHDEGWPRNLFRRGDSWILDFYFRGQRYTETLGPMSRTTTQEKRDKRRGDIAAGDLVVNGKVWRNKRWEQVDEQPSVEDILFEEACEKYMEWYKGHSRPRSHERHATSAIALKAAFSGKRLSQISAFAIDKYKLERKAAKKAEATINRELTMLKHTFSKCITWKFAKSTPMKDVKLYKESNNRVRYLTDKESRRLLAACNKDFVSSH